MNARIKGRTIQIDETRVRGEQPMGKAVMANEPMLCIHSVSLSPSPLPGWPKRTDKWNYLYAQFLEREKLSGAVRMWWYEPFSLWLPGKVRYKPDFLVWRTGSDKMELVEVKGWSKNLRDGMTRLKIAAELFPCWNWKLVRRERGEWDVRML